MEYLVIWGNGLIVLGRILYLEYSVALTWLYRRSTSRLELVYYSSLEERELGRRICSLDDALLAGRRNSSRICRHRLIWSVGNN